MIFDLIKNLISPVQEAPVSTSNHKGTTQPKTKSRPIVTCLGEYEHEWPKVYFHGDAERLFWNLEPEEVVDAPDRVCGEVELASLHPGTVTPVEVEFTDLRSSVYYEDGLLFLWESMGPRDVKDRLRGLIVLDGDDEAVDYARSCMNRRATKI